MDLVIFLILIALVIVFFRDVKFVVYLIGILEIFFRILHYLGDHITFINIKYIIILLIVKIFSIFLILF